MAGLALLACAATVRAEGELRSQFLVAGTASFPKVESAPAVDANGVVYVGATLNTTNPTGMVLALTTDDTGRLVRKWRVDLNASVEASPLLTPNGAVVLGDMNGVLHAFDKETGADRGSVDVKPLLPAASATLGYIHSSASITPDGSAIYVGVGVLPGASQPAGLLCAFSPSLQRLWSVALPDSVESSPAIAADGTIFIGCVDSNVYAIDPSTHAIKWQRKLDGPVYASAAIGPDGTVFIGTYANQFVALKPNGDLKWSVGITATGSAAVGPDGRVYVANYADGYLYALDTQTGNTVWRQPGWPQAGSTPAVRADDTVIFGGNEADYGVLRAYKGDTGQILWTSGTLITDWVLSSAVISPADHAIYIGSIDGKVYGFAGNEFGLSHYASWPMFQHDPSHSGEAPTVVGGGQLINLATRGVVGPSSDLIAGYVLKGAGIKKLLVRAVGPTLQQFQVLNPVPDPVLTIRLTNSNSANPDAFKFVNDNWWQGDDVADVVSSTAAVGTFPLPAGSKDAALVSLAGQFQSLNYTGAVDSADGRTGISLIEVYDADSEQKSVQLVNLSTRGHVGTGDDVLIPGLIIRGTGKARVLMRAVGPSLTRFNVTGVLARPSFAVYDQNQRVIAQNAGWTADAWKDDIIFAQKQVGAFDLDPNSADAAMILALDPGAYTFPVSGVGGTTGEVLVEVYLLPY